jgi:SAM-dependent methyltransferase
MSKVWDKIYESDSAFFGDEPSHFATLCLREMKTNNVKKLLELGAGHGRDSIFFASNGIQVAALDYSNAGIEIILHKAKKEKKELQVNSKTFDIRNALPFPNNYFDAVYSHMFLNMKFSQDELGFIISEIRRVLKDGGFNFFSVRNNHDSFYTKGIEIEKGIYNINGFEIRFFTEKDIQDLLRGHFQLFWIKEESEDPVTLYLICSKKNSY